MCKLSIVTPTYNRAPYLEQCFRSLEAQTNHDFEWILVDDGSTDNTADIVSAFHTDRFPIRFVRKANGGKHTALNASHPYIHGTYVLILDSDDYLTETAVETVLAAWGRFEQNPEVGIVTFLKGTDVDHPVCAAAEYDVPVEIMRYRRIRYTRTDCCEVIRAELFKRYPFPEFAGERFLAESALWDRVSFTHKCVYQPSVIYICEYLDGGLTKSGRAMRIRNPQGGMYTANLRMDRRNFAAQRWKSGMLYTCYGRFAHKSIAEQLKETDHPGLAAACYPFGFALYLYWKHRYY